jgi:hypothetical protein
MFRDPASSTFRNILVASVIGVGVFLIPNGAQSATSNSATIQWATNQESDLAGYRVYHGTISGNYGNYQNAGKTTTYQYANLESDKTHYFSVTAYDSSGNESNPSLEVKTFIQAAVPPTLTSPNPNTTLEGATTTFTWTPNETSVFEWWLFVGTSMGANDIYDSGRIVNATSDTVSGLPTNGSTLYVQLWYKITDGPWEGRDYQFTAVGGSTSSFPLTISKSGEGSGTITSNPIGLSCGSTCTASFSTDSPVTLSANPASDSIFSGWSGGGCSGTSSCTLTLSSSASVSANFASSPPPSSSSSVTEEEIKSQQQLAEAAKPQEQQQLAKAAKREQQQLAKAAKQERKQLAKAAKLSAKIQRILAKIEQKLITHADNPKAVDLLNRKKVELLVKRDKIQENLSIN